jgi:hypothetical protein
MGRGGNQMESLAWVGSWMTPTKGKERGKEGGKKG